MTTHTETLTSLLKLPSEVLRLRLAGANLAMNGSKRDQARRLWDHIRQNPPTDQRRSRRQTRERGHGTTTTTSQPSQQHTQANIAEKESNSSGDNGNNTDDGSNPLGSSSGSEGSDSSLEDDDQAVLRRVGQTSRNRHGSPASGAVRRQEADKNPARSSQLPPSSRRHRSWSSNSAHEETGSTAAGLPRGLHVNTQGHTGDLSLKAVLGEELTLT